MPNGINFSGLASGIDTDAIVRQLVALERLPITALVNRKVAEQAKLAKLDVFKSLVLTLQERAQSMRKLEDFLDFEVSASNEGVADFRVSGAAIAGTHTLTVNHTATTDRWAFDGVPDPDVDLALADGDYVKFTVGGDVHTIDVTASSSSLHDIAEAINSDAGEEVVANVVNTGTESAPSWRLIVASRHSGEEGRISDLDSTIAGLTIDGTGPATDHVPTSANNIVVGRNAEVVIDGLTVERSSNEFSDVLTGVTFTVESADETLETQFTISPDYEAIQQKVVDLVDAYNALVRFRNEQSAYDEESGPGGPLFGDSILSQVNQRIGAALFDIDIRLVQADEGGFTTLGLVGIETQNDGTLEIDEEVLAGKLQSNLDAFGDLFIDTDGFDNGGAVPGSAGHHVDLSIDHGIADSIVRAVDLLVKTSSGPGGIVLKGAFAAKAAAIDARTKSLDDSIEAKERYLEVYEANLRQRFAVLEQIIGGLNAQGSALTSIFQ